MNRIKTVAGVIGISFLTMTGCDPVETVSEDIVVRPDGSGTVSIKVGENDLEIFARDPFKAPRQWTVNEVVDQDEETRKESRHFVWETDLADINDYPDSLSGIGDPGFGSYLRWETRLDVEALPGRRIYRFTRRYIGRRAGKYPTSEDFDSREELDLLKSRPMEELTEEEKQEFAELLAQDTFGYDFFVHMQQVWDGVGRGVENGILDLSERTAILEGLRAFLEELDESDFEYLLSLSDEELEQENDRFQKRLFTEVERFAPPERIDDLFSLIAGEKSTYQVTEALADERIRLSVDLPGIVVFSNSDSDFEDIDSGVASWEIQGTDLREGDIVLTAVSVLEGS